jgi:hypothetical protein
MTVQRIEEYALNVYFNKQDEENSFYFPSPPRHAWSFDFLEIHPSIHIRKPSYYCRAALAMTRYLPLSEDLKLINQERERM